MFQAETIFFLALKMEQSKIFPMLIKIARHDGYIAKYFKMHPFYVTCINVKWKELNIEVEEMKVKEFGCITVIGNQDTLYSLIGYKYNLSLFKNWLSLTHTMVCVNWVLIKICITVS